MSNSVVTVQLFDGYSERTLWAMTELAIAGQFVRIHTDAPPLDYRLHDEAPGWSRRHYPWYRADLAFQPVSSSPPVAARWDALLTALADDYRATADSRVGAAA